MDMTGLTGLNQTGLHALGFNTSSAQNTATLNSVAGTTASAVADQYVSSDMMTFISEYEQLSATEQQEVQTYLNEVAAVASAGNDLSSIKTETPDFISRMISMGIGGTDDGSTTYANGYRSRVQASSENNNEETTREEEDAKDAEEEASYSGRGVQVLEQKEVTDMVTDQRTVISETGTVSALLGQSADSSNAADTAPQELQELAEKLGKDLSSILEKYLDSGCSEQAAYTQAMNELRRQDSGASEKDEAEEAAEV